MAIQAPEGTRDLLPDEAKFWAHFKATAADVFGRYGYAPIETPLFEQTELFVRGIGEATDVVSKEMFTAISGQNLATLLDGGTVKAKSRLSLRPEGTAGVVRAVVQHDLVPQGAAPAKLMYAGPMFRAERPQKGRQRQFNQVGIECLGAEEPSVDAEGIIMLMRFYAAIGIPVGSHAPAGELDGLRRVPSGLPRGRARVHGRAARRAVRRVQPPCRDQPAARVRLQEPRLRRRHGGRAEDHRPPVRRMPRALRGREGVPGRRGRRLRGGLLRSCAGWTTTRAPCSRCR